MAAKNRKPQSTDASNGKSNASKGSGRPKFAAKAKSKDDEHSKKNANSVLYKICLFALGKFFATCIWHICSSVYHCDNLT